VVAVKYWDHPKTLNILRGLLEFIGYYRKFVKNYGKIVSPLTSLLKTNVFVWSEVAAHAFNTLKNSMFTTSILFVPNVNNIFSWNGFFMERSRSSIDGIRMPLSIH
jgi:hypothetical protein